MSRYELMPLSVRDRVIVGVKEEGSYYIEVYTGGDAKPTILLPQPGEDSPLTNRLFLAQSSDYVVDTVMPYAGEGALDILLHGDKISLRQALLNDYLYHWTSAKAPDWWMLDHAWRDPRLNHGDSSKQTFLFRHWYSGDKFNGTQPPLQDAFLVDLPWGDKAWGVQFDDINHMMKFVKEWVAVQIVDNFADSGYPCILVSDKKQIMRGGPFGQR